MKIQCPACKREYQIDDSLAREHLECECGEKFFAVPLQDEEQPTKKCPMCGETILAVAQKCRYCGEYLDELSQMKKKVNRVIYTILGLLFGGIGVHNFYAGGKEKLAGYGHWIMWGIGLIFLFIAEENATPALCVLSFGNAVWVLCEIVRGPACYQQELTPKERKKRNIQALILLGILLLPILVLVITAMIAKIF